MYDDREFGGIDTIHELTGRSTASIKMKISNITAILDEEEIPRNRRVSALSGVKFGESGRRTNWDIIEPLTRRGQDDLRLVCRRIVDSI